MVGAMAKVVEAREDDDLVVRARTQADALGRLYETYYEPIFRFCVHRLFVREIAEDVTSAVFLDVARGIRSFRGTTRGDFQNWLYSIAANKANAYIRKTSRRRTLLAEARTVELKRMLDHERSRVDKLEEFIDGVFKIGVQDLPNVKKPVQAKPKPPKTQP